MRARYSVVRDWVTSLFPVRVWRLFLRRNGMLLSAGISFQALFAVFAAAYLAFSLAGVWFAGNTDRMLALIETIDRYVPGLIGEDGAVSVEQALDIANANTAQLGWAGLIAAAALLWTAIGWITSSRVAVRSMLGLAKDARPYALLKTFDALAALVFGVALLLGTALTTASTNALSWIVEVLGFGELTTIVNIAATAIGLLLVFAIDALVLSAMLKFLSGTTLEWRDTVGGVLVGSALLVGLQVAGTAVVGSSGRNPLLATFVVFVALLLWFRLTSIFTLVSAAWTAERIESSGRSLVEAPLRRPRHRRAGSHA